MAVTWNQWTHGFDGNTTDAGCTTTIATSDPSPDTNKVTSTIASANDANDTAVAYVTTAARLPTNDQGRIRFKFNTGTRVAGTDNHTILRVMNAALTLSIIDVYIRTDGTIGLFSDVGTLDELLVFNLAGSTTLATNTEYTIEVAYLGSTGTGASNVTLWLNGSQEFTSTGTMGATNDCDAGKLLLGIDHYDGLDGSGFTHSFRWGQLSDDSSTGLTDPLTSTPGAFQLRGVG